VLFACLIGVNVLGLICPTSFIGWPHERIWLCFIGWIIVAVGSVGFVIIISARGERHRRSWFGIEFLPYGVVAGLFAFINLKCYEMMIASI